VSAVGLVGASGSASAQGREGKESQRIGVISGYHSSDSDAPPITAKNILEYDRLWPYQVALVEDWTPPGAQNPIAKDTLGVLVRVEPDGTARIDFGRAGRQTVPLAATDIVERANRVRLGELEKLMPNLLHAVGPRLVDPSSDPPRDPTLEELYVYDAYLTVFADPDSAEFDRIAVALAPLEGRHRVKTILFPQGQRGNEKVIARLRALDWKVPFVLFRFSDPYTRSQLAEGTPPPAVMLQTADGRVLFESSWQDDVAGALEVAIDVEFGKGSASAQVSDPDQAH
jgi:hypothetical protein